MQVLFGGLETNDKPVQASDGSRYTLVDDQTEQAAKSDISVVYRQTPEHLELWCRYDPALFKQETIANLLAWFEIGRASCRERVCQYVYISVVAVSLKKKYQTYNKK